MAVHDQGFKKTGWLGLKLFCRRDAPALGARKPALNALLSLTTFLEKTITWGICFSLKTDLCDLQFEGF